MFSAFGARVDVPVEVRCERASVVALVEVTSQESRWAGGDTAALETETWAHVLEVWKGRLSTDTVSILSQGGRLSSGLYQWVEHEPSLVVDQRYLVLLTPTEGGFVVSDGDAGVVPLAKAGGLVEACRD